MYTHRVCKLQFINFIRCISYILTISTLRIINSNIAAIYIHDPANITIENLFLIVIANLHHLITGPQNISRRIDLTFIQLRRIDPLLKQMVKVLNATGILMHRR